jgi:hypothetical protein
MPQEIITFSNTELLDAFQTLAQDYGTVIKQLLWISKKYS